MKALFTVAFCTFSVLTSLAQKSPIKFGDIPLEDLKMTTYPQDSSAHAVILTDYGESYLVASKMSGARYIPLTLATPAT
jgi:hypothetical protein